MAPLVSEDHSIFDSSMQSLPPLFSSSSQLSYYTNDDKTQTFSSHGKTQKRVRFSNYSLLYLIPNLDYYSQEERESMFLTSEDNERIRKENDRTIAEIRKGNLPDTESECFRGLEWRGVRHLSNQKRALRQIAVSLILSEQEQGDEICPDWIENVYCKITEDSVTRANEVASLDAQID